MPEVLGVALGGTANWCAPSATAPWFQWDTEGYNNYTYTYSPKNGVISMRSKTNMFIQRSLKNIGGIKLNVSIIHIHHSFCAFPRFLLRKESVILGLLFFFGGGCIQETLSTTLLPVIPKLLLQPRHYIGNNPLVQGLCHAETILLCKRRPTHCNCLSQGGRGDKNPWNLKLNTMATDNGCLEDGFFHFGSSEQTVSYRSYRGWYIRQKNGACIYIYKHQQIKRI